MTIKYKYLDNLQEQIKKQKEQIEKVLKSLDYLEKNIEKPKGGKDE